MMVIGLNNNYGYDMCMHWQCVVDPENNKGIEQCFSNHNT